MSTKLLKERLDQAYKDLQEIADTSSLLRSGGSLNATTYEFYKECAPMGEEIRQTAELIDVRQSALDIMQNIKKIDSNKVLFQEHSIDFWHARLLGLQSYVAINWSIYDSLSKVAGKLICIDEVAKNLKKPPKLPEDFLMKGKSVGAHMNEHLKQSYGWPIGFSYALRNWLLHDGNSKDGMELFTTRDAEFEPYRIADQAWDNLARKCREEYKVTEEQTRLKMPWPWHQEDLRQLLILLQAEIDDATGILMVWATESVKSQATLLLIRDKK